MGTEIVRPQDCLIERLRVNPAVFHRRKSYAGNHSKSNRKHYNRPEYKKHVLLLSDHSNSDELRSGKDFVIGQVTILKKGESLASRKDDLIVCSTNRSGPDPETVPKQIRVKDLKSFFSPPVDVGSDMYAGSAFSLSPSPRALPLPSFSKKKGDLSIVNDSATMGLRRLLRLD